MQSIPHTVEEIVDALPHGSGIDADWTVISDSRHRKEIGCSYHAMDENGMYDGWVDFSVVIFQHTADKFNPLRGPCEGKTQVLHRRGDVAFRIVGQFSANRRNSTYGLKSYLEEIISSALHDAKIVASRTEIIDNPPTDSQAILAAMGSGPIID